MSRPRDDSGRTSVHRLDTLHFEKVAPGWPDIILCRFSRERSAEEQQALAIFCESECELADVATVLLARASWPSTRPAALTRIRSLCAGPSRLSAEGLAIYATPARTAPWLYVEAIHDLSRPSLARGRYDWTLFACFDGAQAHLTMRHRLLTEHAGEPAGYRPPTLILSTRPTFLPGPWE